MKPLCFIVTVLLLGHSPSYAQDTTAQRPDVSRFGWRVWFDMGLLENRSLNRIGQQLTDAGVAMPTSGNYLSNFGFSLVNDRRRSYGETRFLVATGESDTELAAPGRVARFYGFGLGALGTYKAVNTRRFIIGPGLGYDVMWYRLALQPPNPGNLPLGSIVANPAATGTIRFRQGFYVTLNGAVSADYRVYWFQRFYNEFRIGLRAGYQFPLLRSRSWYYGDGTVSDLSGFNASTLYGHFGLTMVPKLSTK